MSAPFINNIGAYVASTAANAPASNAAGTRNSTGFDRFSVFSHSCVLVEYVGAASGTPTSFTVDAKIQHSSDNGSTDAWSDYTAPEGAAAITTATAAGLVEKDVNLQGAKQYIRVTETVAFVGGTSPAVQSASLLVMGGSTNPPI